jgi:hypothetical protein
MAAPRRFVQDCGMRMEELSAELTRVVAEVSGAFREMSGLEWTLSRGETAWTRLEILGHLIDSARNNHERVARAVAQGELAWPGYDQDEMVRVHRYGLAAPGFLVTVWEAQNLAMARLVGLIPEERLGAMCRIGDEAPVTLEYLAHDYVAHMQHHLRQILDGEAGGVRWVELD